MPVLTGVVHVYSFLELSLYMSANTHTHTHIRPLELTPEIREKEKEGR